MKKFLLILTCLAITAACEAASLKVHWTCTTETNPWVDKGAVKTETWDNDTACYIEVDPRTKYQQIVGWGGCFNELGWDALMSVSKEKREKVVKDLFDPKEGCKFNICRMPIGTNDFSASFRSLDDEAGDYSMSKFSLEKDRAYLIPFIRAAQVYRPDVRIFGSPWSPPAWMKTNRAVYGGRLKQDPETLKAYALYFEKYVQEYQKEHINVFAVTVQNEPVISSNYPSCLWNGAEMRDFIKNYLGPQFKKDKVKAQIWQGTINDPKYEEYISTVMNDKEARSYIQGIGLQWGGRPMIPDVRKDYPEQLIYQTEHDCGNCWWGDWGWGPYVGDGAPNHWKYGDYSFGLMLDWLRLGVNAYTQWNMVLEHKGMSLVKWPQNAMVSVWKETGEVKYNPQFYAVKHLSYYILPGAYRVESSGNFDGIGDAKSNTVPGADNAAFVNPKGEVVIAVRNNTDKEQAVAIRIGDVKIKPTIPARSFNTFTVSGKIPMKNTPKAQPKVEKSSK